MAKEFSFKKGWNQLPKALNEECRDKIIAALSISLPTFYARLRGDVEPKFSEGKSIEAIFAEYGIVDVWGE